MNEIVKKHTNQQILAAMVKSDAVVEGAQKMLGERAGQFLSSVLSLANSNKYLADNVDPNSLYNSCLMAASLNLPVNQNLGFAWIIPYKTVAQLQIGWKGYVQLAIRSGQFSRINVSEVREGELEDYDVLTGDLTLRTLTEGRKMAKIVGYVAYFRLKNGFEKSLYMTTEEVTTHAQRYSKSFRDASGVWKTNFEEMAKKTVLKLLLSRFAPMDITMQKAIENDQAADGEYVDNQPEISEAEVLLDGSSKEEKENG